MRVFLSLGNALLLASLGLFFSSRALLAEIVVHFDQDVYFVTGPGETIDTKILIDTDAKRPGDQPPVEGLFSFGVASSFNASKASVGSVADVAAAAPLDFFGFGAGAFESVAAGFAGVKGNIDQLVNPLVPYRAPLLAEITFTNLAAGPDSYPLGLDFFNTLGENEQLFVDGTGAALDPQIQFRPARVVVIPEPATGALCLIAVLAFACGSKSIARAARRGERHIGSRLPGSAKRHRV